MTGAHPPAESDSRTPSLAPPHRSASGSAALTPALARRAAEPPPPPLAPTPPCPALPPAVAYRLRSHPPPKRRAAHPMFRGAPHARVVARAAPTSVVGPVAGHGPSSMAAAAETAAPAPAPSSASAVRGLAGALFGGGGGGVGAVVAPPPAAAPAAQAPVTPTAVVATPPPPRPSARTAAPTVGDLTGRGPAALAAFLNSLPAPPPTTTPRRGGGACGHLPAGGPAARLAALVDCDTDRGRPDPLVPGARPGPLALDLAPGAGALRVGPSLAVASCVVADGPGLASLLRMDPHCDPDGFLRIGGPVRLVAGAPAAVVAGLSSSSGGGAPPRRILVAPPLCVLPGDEAPGAPDTDAAEDPSDLTCWPGAPGWWEGPTLVAWRFRLAGPDE